MKYTTLLIVFTSLFFFGCGEEATYEGKTVSEWIRLSDDSDWETSSKAYDALEMLAYEDSRARAKFEERYGDFEEYKREERQRKVEVWIEMRDEAREYGNEELAKSYQDQIDIYKNGWPEEFPK